QPDSALVSRRIGSQRYVMCASPAYLRRHGTPRCMADLAQHRLIDRQHSTSVRGWRELAGIDWRQPPQVALESNDCDTRRLCAARGLGIALMPNWAIGEDLAAGRIVALQLEDAPPAEVSGIHLLRPSGKANAKVRAFTEHLLHSIGAAAGWVGAVEPQARGPVLQADAVPA
ncbi:substrate binding domain-containing protein, partial [Sphingobium herbicidovorans]